MFDIGFFELFIVAVLSLIIFGPERLPQVIKTLALWVGRIKRKINSVKADIEREVGAEDIRRQLHNEAILENLDTAERSLQAGQAAIKEAIEPHSEKSS